MPLRTRIRILSRDGHRCVYCGRSPRDGAVLEVDHRIPRSKGGGDDDSNLFTACWACNSGKSDTELAAPA